MDNINKLKSKVFKSFDDQLIVYDDTEERVTISGNDSKQLPIIICIPGVGDTRYQFRYISSLLANEGFRVISIDLRGMGFISSLPKSMTITDVSNDLCNFLSTFKISKRRGFMLLAHGESSIPAFITASENPDIIKGIILISPFAGKIESFNIKGYVKYNSSLPWNIRTWFSYYKSLYKKPIHNLPPGYDQYMMMIKQMMKYEKRFMMCKQYNQSTNEFNLINIKYINCPIYIASPGMNSLLKNIFDFDYIYKQTAMEVPIIETKEYQNSGHFIHVESTNELSNDITKWIISNYSFKMNGKNEYDDRFYIQCHKPIKRKKQKKRRIIFIGNVA